MLRPSARDAATRVLELHARRLLKLRAVLADVEELALAEAEHAGEQRGRELLDAGVIFLHRVVVEAARGGELVLDVGDVRLQLLEIRVGLQVRIVLRQREQLPQCAGAVSYT